MLDRGVSLQGDIGSIGEVTAQSGMGLRRLVLIAGPYVNVICVAFWGQQLSIHRRRTNDRNLPWMADYLFDLNIGMLFCSIVVKYRLELRNQVVVLFRNLYICQNNVVWIVCPGVVSWVVQAVSLTGEVNSLVDHFWVLVHERTPLNRCGRPV